ncbi:MAG: glycoside hydrolase family 88 protein [Prevotella sp.]|jgi:rhamnogalacturonyl hydrolase YesR|nr:glycoside hydrolase family 88 protein [Prevotella sp.]
MKQKILFFILFLVCASTQAETPEEFKNFPPASEPGVIGKRLVQRYLSRFQIATKTYPETCTWFGALRFADIVQDGEMLRRLEENFLSLDETLLPKPDHVDNTVFGVVPLQLYLQTGTQAYYDFGMNFADKQWTMPSNPSAANRAKYEALLRQGLSWQTRYWVDDMYMITSIQSRAYLASQDEKYINRAAHEMIAYIDSIQQPNGLLYHHAETAPFFWCRGNGWMAAGMTDLLSLLPENNPDRPQIMQEYLKMMATLKSYRNAEGLWNQLIDEPDAWTETSGSAMFTYAMITGVKKGWLDAEEYAPVARKAWLALLTYLNEDAAIGNVCEGTNIGTTKQYYLDRAQNTGDLHGQAALLWCAVALYNIEDNSEAKLTSLAYDACTLSPAFNSDITEYVCFLPVGATSVTPILTTSYGASLSGAGIVNVSGGTSVQNIVVTSLDGTTTNTYTIRFAAGNGGDYTSLIVNNDFELAPDANCNPVPVTAGMDAWSNSAWRPKNSSCSQKQFYGWTCDLSLTGSSTSQGINADASGKHGDWVCWIGGNRTSYAEIELSQTIDRSLLPSGTYRMLCLLAVGSNNKKNNQRIFANNNVQYYGAISDYPGNLVTGENYTFAGHNSFAESELKEMKLYVTVGDGEPLKIGVRTSNKIGNGSVVQQQSPMFKTDYYRLIKIDSDNAADARLARIALSAGSLNFSPETTTYNVTLPAGTQTVTSTATPNIQDAAVSGDGKIDVSGGTGVQNIAVMALDGTTSKTYTINYTVDDGNGINDSMLNTSYSVLNRKLTVNGVASYAVYCISGTQIADVKGSSVELLPGAYIVKLKNAKAFKVIVR